METFRYGYIENFSLSISNTLDIPVGYGHIPFSYKWQPRATIVEKPK